MLKIFLSCGNEFLRASPVEGSGEALSPRAVSISGDFAMANAPGRLSRGAMSRCGDLVELGVDMMRMTRGQAVLRPKGALPLCTAQL